MMRLRDYIDYIRSPNKTPVGDVVMGDLETLDGLLYLTSWVPGSRLLENFQPHPYFVEDYTRMLTPKMKARFNLYVILGPQGSCSRLHFDGLCTHTYLGQFYGRKQCVLFSPEDSPFLYEGHVDPTAPDLERFPLLEQATPYVCTLEPGELIFMPPNWWHCGRCLDPSITISFNFINSSNFGAYFEALNRFPFVCADPK